MERFRSKWREICADLRVQCEEMHIDISDVKFSGRGFFPGADGRCDPSSEASRLDLMILGHDFGTVKYAQNQAGEKDEKCRTWLELGKILKEVGIKNERCFFTNCIIGYRSKRQMAGYLPIDINSNFYKACKFLLQYQINHLDPRLILALGKDAAIFLSEFSAGKKIPKSASWEDINNYLSTDGLFSVEISGKEFSVFPMMHPAYRRRNLVYRKKTSNWEESCIRSILENLQANAKE